MEILYLALIFLFGLVLASFLNAQMYRWEKSYKLKKLLTFPSHCENCKKKLLWYELIPVFSYIFQKGKCLKCKKKISIYHPLSELFLGISFTFLFINDIQWYMYIALCFLFVMSYWDFAVMGFPKILAHLLLIFSSFTYIFNTLSYGYMFVIESGLVVGIVFSLVFLLSNLFYKNKKVFGMGDMFVILSISSLLTFRQALMFSFSSVLIGSIYGIIYALRNKRDLKFYIPFVIFLTIGFVISLLIPLPSWIY